jgi:hypothetical protein
MNPPRRRNNRSRSGGRSRQRAAVDLWRVPEPPGEIRPIAVPDEPSALVRSLGDPPVANGTTVGRYLVAVTERAAATAAALALSADLLAGSDDGSDAAPHRP